MEMQRKEQLSEKLSELKKKFERSSLKLVDRSSQVKTVGFIGGVRNSVKRTRRAKCG
jgi:ABC-type phosphate transport system auxiliary subunit